MTELLSKLFVKDHENISNPKVRTAYGTFSSIVGIIINFLLAGGKLLAGFLSGSVAVTADAVNNFSDAGSSAVSLVSFKIAAKPADKDHPFGHARIEYVASLIVSFLILHVGLDLLTDSAKTILGLSESSGIDVTALTIVILSCSILFKLWLGVFYRNIGKKIDSSVILASSADCFSDCISTTAVLICSIVIKLTDFAIIDAIVGLIVSLLILWAGIKILNETKNSILGEAPVEETVTAIEEIAKRYPEIVGIHDMLVHNYGSNHFIASFHAEVDSEQNVFHLHDVVDNVEMQIGKELGIACTIHMDPIALNDAEVNELKEFAISVIKSIDESITIHDFRAVIGDTHTNIIFDIVLPFESEFSPKSIKELISKKIAEQRSNVNCVITVDRG